MNDHENYLDASGNGRVYIDFYNLKETPFSITPDPEYLFLSQTHHNVIEKVLYSIDNRMGFVHLSGEVGTGKTTICRSIIDTLKDKAEIVYIINPSLSGKDLISSILDDMGIQYAANESKKILINHLNTFLLNRQSRKPVVIIIDDAQTMPMEALEDLRLLSNLETDKEKMLQVVIVGQPELDDLLSQSGMRQLKQRIFVNCRLDQLNPNEVESYIDIRLFYAGSNGQVQFTRGAKRAVAKKSQGIPRVINKICDFALTAGYVSDELVIQKKHVKQAMYEMGDTDFKRGIFSGRKLNQSRFGNLKFMAATTALCLIFVFVTTLWTMNGKLYPIQVGNITKQGIPREHIQNPVNADDAELISSLTSTADKAVTHLSPNTKMKDNLTGTAHKLSQKLKAATWVPSYNPFTIQLGTFKTFEQVVRAISIYASSGLEVHWNSIDSGNKEKWYRVFTGHFESQTEAQKIKKDRGLTNALIRFNPWSVLIGKYTDVNNLTSIRSWLRSNQYDSLIVESADGINWLLTGAFETKRGAEKLAQELRALNLSVKVVPR
jgi:general secretion pathway protein A